jgi:hypothetical protein
MDQLQNDHFLLMMENVMGICHVTNLTMAICHVADQDLTNNVYIK